MEKNEKKINYTKIICRIVKVKLVFFSNIAEMKLILTLKFQIFEILQIRATRRRVPTSGGKSAGTV